MRNKSIMEFEPFIFRLYFRAQIRNFEDHPFQGHWSKGHQGHLIIIIINAEEYIEI